MLLPFTPPNRSPGYASAQVGELQRLYVWKGGGWEDATHPEGCHSIFNSQTVPSPGSLDSGSADTQNHNSPLIKEILSETSKAGKSETGSL